MKPGSIHITKLGKQTFKRNLKGRRYEDPETIASIESLLIKKRGYVFRMPKKGSDVILLLSGGLDSVITWELLFRVYRYQVYPLYLNRGKYRNKREGESMRFFCRYFKKLYPEQYHEPKEFTFLMPIPELEKEMSNGSAYFHPSRIILQYSGNTKVTVSSQNGLPFALPLYAAAYANYLLETQNKTIYTIFSAIAPSDGLSVISQSFTSLRLVQLALCTTSNDFNWNFCSFLFEPEIGHWIEKHELIRIAARHSLPIHKTWSCYHHGILQCGDGCLGCKARRFMFEKSGIPDSTYYASDYRPDRIALVIRRTLRKKFPSAYQAYKKIRGQKTAPES